MSSSEKSETVNEASSRDAAKPLAQRMFSGAGWMIGLRLVHRGIGVLSMLILVRLLDPADFGLIAMATSIVAMVELIGAFGFDVMLIQRQDATRQHYDTVWTFTVAFGGLIAGILVFLAGAGSRFFGEPRLELVIYVLALSTFIGGLKNVGIVKFRKDLQYHKDFIFSAGIKVIGFAVTIPLAFLLRSYWALVFGIVATNVGAVVFSYAYSPYRPRLSLKASSDVMGYSKWILLNSFAYFVRKRSVDFIVGRMAGATSLGLLSVSREIATLPTSEMVLPINRAAMPVYAKVSSNLASLRRGYLGVVSAVALIVAPAGVGLALTAHLVVPLLLGEAWAGAVVPIQILSIMGMLMAMQANSSTICFVLDRVRLLTILTSVSIPIMLLLVVSGTRWNGVEGAALGLLGTVMIMMPINYAVICRVLQINATQLLRAVWRPYVSVAVMAAVCSLIDPGSAAPAAASEAAIRLFELIVVGASTYAVSVMSLWWLVGRPEGGEQYLLDQLSTLLRRARPKAA